MCSGRGRRTYTPVSFEVSLFGDPRIEACLPAPRGLSQVTTSFIGSWCLGIHRLPLVACHYHYKDARVHCVVLNIRADPFVQDLTEGLGRPAAERSCNATDPSGPNSVLGLRPTTVRFHSLAGCTDAADGAEL